MKHAGNALKYLSLLFMFVAVPVSEWNYIRFSGWLQYLQRRYRLGKMRIHLHSYP